MALGEPSNLNPKAHLTSPFSTHQPPAESTLPQTSPSPFPSSNILCCPSPTSNPICPAQPEPQSPLVATKSTIASLQALLDSERTAHQSTLSELSRVLSTQGGIDGKTIGEIAFLLASGEIEATDAVQLLFEEIEKAQYWVAGNDIAGSERVNRSGPVIGGPEARLEEVETGLAYLSARLEVIVQAVLGEKSANAPIISALASQKIGDKKGVDKREVKGKAKAVFKSNLQRLGELENEYVMYDIKLRKVEAMLDLEDKEAIGEGSLLSEAGEDEDEEK